MQGTATIQDIATEAAGWFESAKRRSSGGGSGSYVKTKQDAPEWVVGLVREAHAGRLPEDYRYSMIRRALDWIAETDDANLDDDRGEFADDAVDLYTSERLAWLASDIERAGYCDEAVKELGDGSYPKGGIVEVLGWGQYLEASEVFGLVVRQLEARAEELATN